MPELDDLVRAMRDDADRLPVVPLLMGVREQAAGRRGRRRTVVGVASVACLALVAGGMALLGRHPAPAATPRPPHSVTDPSALVGPTWYLQSWTMHGTTTRPDTERPPTLVFDSREAAHSDDPTNTTTWTVQLGRGTLVAVQGPTTTVAESLADQAVDAAMEVLDGTASWRLSGADLVVSKPDGSALHYTRDAGAALALGGLDVDVEARAYQPFGISGSVIAIGPTGSATLHETVGADGLHVSRLAPGTWTLTATVPGGTCAPTAVAVTGGMTARAVVLCLLGKDNGALQLVGHSWFLTSWTTPSGQARTPQVVPPPSLEFDNAARARSGDGCDDTFWTVTIGSGVLDTVPGTTNRSTSTPECEAVHPAVAAVLVGHSTWSVDGSQLTINGAHGGRLTYTRDSHTALAAGGVGVSLWANHAAGLVTAGAGHVAGLVTVRSPAGQKRQAAAGLHDLATFVGLAPGTYTVSAVIKNGSCTPGTVTVVAGELARARLSCVDGRSSD